jgi:hypothetical protein
VILFFSPETGFWGQDWDSLGVALTLCLNVLRTLSRVRGIIRIFRVPPNILLVVEYPIIEVFQYFNRRPPEPPPSPPTVALLHSGTSPIFFFIVLAACSSPFSETIFSFLVNKKESHIYKAQTVFDLPKMCSICYLFSEL